MLTAIAMIADENTEIAKQSRAALKEFFLINDTVDLVLFFSLRPQYAAVGDCCYPICCGALLRIDIKSTES